jgi:hypothetical protein
VFEIILLPSFGCGEVAQPIKAKKLHNTTATTMLRSFIGFMLLQLYVCFSLAVFLRRSSLVAVLVN